MSGRSSLALLVPDAEPLVGDLRRAHDPAAFAGFGAHVTLLFPFVPAAELTAEIVAHIRCPGGPLGLVFDRVARFPGLAYLALRDPAPVVALARALAAAWPAYPPYEGKYPDPVPHLTVAHGEPAALEAVERVLAPRLPLVTSIAHVTLMVEDDADRWHERARIPL